MGMSMVRRRIAGYVKANPRSKKKHAPLPRRRDDSDDEVMVGEAAVESRPFMAVSPRRQPEPTLLQKAWKPVVGALAALLVAGVGFLVFGGSGYERSYSSYRETARSSPAPSQAGAGSAPRRAAGQEYPGNGGAAPPVSLADRALPTDESFRATAYVRKKVDLPNISGNCVIRGDGARDMDECLRRQGG